MYTSPSKPIPPGLRRLCEVGGKKSQRAEKATLERGEQGPTAFRYQGSPLLQSEGKKTLLKKPRSEKGKVQRGGNTFRS